MANYYTTIMKISIQMFNTKWNNLTKEQRAQVTDYYYDNY